MAEPLLKEVDYFATLATLHDYVENARIFGQFGGFSDLMFRPSLEMCCRPFQTEEESLEDGCGWSRRIFC